MPRPYFPADGPRRSWRTQPAPLNRTPGFTLIELLVVISIIAVLAAMLFPTVKIIKESTMSSKCGNNQRNVAVALMVYAEDNDGTFPYSFDSRILKFYDTFLVDYLPKVSSYGQHNVAGRMYDCPSMRYDYSSTAYITKCPDYGPNSAIIPRYSPGVSEGRVARISRASEVVLLGDSAPGLTMGLSIASYYITVTPAWLSTRQRSATSSFPCARHPAPSDLDDPMDGISVGGQFFIGIMADGHIEKMSISSTEFGTSSGRQRTFTQP